jgi:osomolarity two-component system phosphorelay intermediate protein YPD1
MSSRPLFPPHPCTRLTPSAEGSLSKLSSLGHFLKGSSAALGIIKVQASCEKMQHYGNKRDEEEGEDLDEAEAMRRIEALLRECKREYVVARAWLKRLYEEDGAE